MVLLFPGKTRCSLCRRVIEIGEERVGFPAFLDGDHPLWRFSDSAMHARCHATWRHRVEFDQLLADAEVRMAALRTPDALAVARAEAESAAAAAAASDRTHNENHDRIMKDVLRVGAACPHCAMRSNQFRELRETSRHRLVCRSCARSLFASELVL